jgi:hypothetical protein
MTKQSLTKDIANLKDAKETVLSHQYFLELSSLYLTKASCHT